MKMKIIILTCPSNTGSKRDCYCNNRRHIIKRWYICDSTNLNEGKNNHIDLSTQYPKQTEIRVRVKVFNVTLNNILNISWRLVLLVEETGENHCPAASHSQSLSHIGGLSTPHLSGIRTHNASVVICTDYMGKCKSNYRTITNTTTSINN